MIGEGIKQARLYRGLTQVQLAALLEVPQPRISEWESGKHLPDRDSIKNIEKALQVEFVTLFIPIHSKGRRSSNPED